jgi:NTE family protein
MLGVHRYGDLSSVFRRSSGYLDISGYLDGERGTALAVSGADAAGSPREEEATMADTALVLGGGGITGIGWELGVLAGLAERGMKLGDADLVVGTSAGSVVGALVSSGADLEELYARQLDPPGSEPVAKMSVGTILRWFWAMARSRDPQQGRMRIGRMALATVTVPESQRREVIEARLGGLPWPQRSLLITAVDAETGEFAVFEEDSTVGDTPVTLVDAVAASCAVPGVWPPITIGARRWIDGGVRSATNADLAAGYERVVVIAPIIQGFRRSSGAVGEVAALRENARVALVAPDAAARRAIGTRMLDPARRGPAARAGRAQAAAVADEIAEVWSP